MMPRNRTWLSILLALLLFTAQQVSLAHTVAHDLDSRHQQHEHGLPHEQPCEQCHTCAEFGSALAPDFTLPLQHAADNLHVPNVVSTSSLPSRDIHFDSRAPPAA